MPKILNRNRLETLRILPVVLLMGGVFLGVIPYLGFVNKTSYYPGYERALDLLFDQPRWMFHMWIAALASVPAALVLLALLRTDQTSTGEGSAAMNSEIEERPQSFVERLIGAAFEWIVALLCILMTCSWVAGSIMMAGTLKGRDSYVHVGASEAAECSISLHDFAIKNGRHEFVGKDYRLMVNLENVYGTISKRYPDCSRFVRDYGRRNAEAEAKELSPGASPFERAAARYSPRYMVDSLEMIAAIKAAEGQES